MKRIFFFMIILLLPVYSWATYKIYLNNGSVISGVSSYDEAGDEVNIYFDTGSMSVPKKDVLKIEGKKSPDTATKERPEAQPEQEREAPRETTIPSTTPEPADDKSARVNELKAELDSVNSEIGSTEEQEAKLVSTINEKTGSRYHYNLIQIRQLEKELEPLRQDLGAVQQKKADLIKRRADIDAEIKSLE